jgi:hypothetical protein
MPVDFKSQRMIDHHEKSKTNKHIIYHWYYTGKGRNWEPGSPRWGGIGRSCFSTLEQIRERYAIEDWEFTEGLRGDRFMLKMVRKYTAENNIGLRMLCSGLSFAEAADAENYFRPEGYNKTLDSRIWNTIAGGI